MAYMSMNPVSDAESYIAHQDRMLERYPVCDICGEHMQEGIKLKDGTRVCSDCWEYADFEPEEGDMPC